MNESWGSQAAIQPMDVRLKYSKRILSERKGSLISQYVCTRRNVLPI